MTSPADARLRGNRSTRVFDTLLRAAAEPGTIQRLPVAELPAEVPPPAWLALALADVDVSVAVVPHDPALVELIVRVTGATIGDVTNAAHVVMVEATAEALRRVDVGDPLEPERGARVAIAVDWLGGVDDAVPPSISPPAVQRLVLSGPGVAQSRSLAVAGLGSGVADSLGRNAASMPCGFDTWLFGPGGTVAAVMRSTAVDAGQTAVAVGRGES